MTSCKSSDLQELCQQLQKKGVKVDAKLIKQLDKLDIYAIDLLKRMV